MGPFNNKFDFNARINFIHHKTEIDQLTLVLFVFSSSVQLPF